MIKNYPNQAMSSRNTNSVGRRVKLLQQVSAGGLGFLNEGDEFSVIASSTGGGVCIQSGVCKESTILKEGSFKFVD